MATAKFNRIVELNSSDRETLIANIGESFIREDLYGNRVSLRISKWASQDGKVERLYVQIGEYKHFLNLRNADDLELDFGRGQQAVEILVAWLNEQAAELAEANAALAEIIAEDATREDVKIVASAPSIEQVVEARQAAGWSVVEAQGGSFGETVHESDAFERMLMMKNLWQIAVVGTLFDAEPVETRRPWRFNEMCLTHDAEWDEILKGISSGMIDWEDFIVSLRVGHILRAA